MAKQDRAVRTRQELIRSAATAFDRHGYALSSLTEISRGAGVSNGALHFHFSSKLALGAAVEASAAQVLEGVVALPGREAPDPLPHLVETSHALARRLADDVVLRAGFGLAADATWMEDVTLWRTWRGWVHATLARARREGSLSPDVPIEDAVSAVTAVVVGAQALGRVDVEWSPQYALAQFWNLMLPRMSAMVPAGRR
ncbi:TetR family transcriptional regulator [Streptomyces sp. NBC_01754]|uniref:ScbR family autoregulator-binding transcription factor n=1 Tax=Streptomyces sp. NBC_01754 TaxID=2975930 RepID=UPI002DDA296C|nr:ScbR family autoregulator-binding transcription factor [Streptomyces sp. NBC_01754]WSC93429.1 TetR family transcriptional regulator [Streptomyces sp. NBC_01754]